MPITLPLTANVPPTEFFSYSVMITGAKKLGKTSLSSQAPNSFVMELEPGNAKGLPIRQVDISSWKEANELLTLLQVTPGYCETLIIDDVPTLFRLCHSHKCRELGIDSPWDMSHGKAFDIINKEFNDFLGKVQALPCGKIYTAHAELQEFQTTGGQKFNRLEPNYPAEVSRFVNKQIQIEGMIYLNEKSERVITFKGTNLIRASCGIPGHFINPKTKEFLNYIPLGNSPEEGWKNLMLAWNNQLEVENGEIVKFAAEGPKKVNKFTVGAKK